MQVGGSDDLFLDEQPAGGPSDGSTAAAAGYIPVPPYRRVDTRQTTKLLARSSRCWPVAGRDGIPATAVAAVLNVVAVAPDGPGHLTVYPADLADPVPPGTSTLNHRAGDVIANGTIAPIGDNGEICVYTHATTDVVVDVSGYFADEDAFSALRPYRRADTRQTSRLPARSHRCWRVGGRGDGVPASAVAVAANLVAVTPSGPGFLSAYPLDKSDATVPTVSALNYAAGQVVANGAIISLGDDSSLCVYTHEQTDVIVDITGYFSATSSYIPVVPTRLVDSRSVARPPQKNTRCYAVERRPDIPAASSVFLNVAAVTPSASGFIRVVPSGAGYETSTLNYAPGEVRANNAIVAPGPDGKICVFTLAATDYVIDIAGYWPSTDPSEANATPAAPQTIYINFDGPVIHDCPSYCSDAGSNRSFAVGVHYGVSSMDFAPYLNPQGRSQIVNAVRAAYTPYHAAVVTNRPSSGDYTMLVVSPTSAPNHGVAPLDCGNANANDIAFVHSIGDNSVSFIGRASVHELGHTFGLSHVLSASDFMHWASRGDLFTVASIDAARDSVTCTSGATQDAAGVLYESLGPAL